MGNVHMEATQINYRGGSKKMSVEEAIKAAGTEITPEEKTWIDSIPALTTSNAGKTDQDVIAPEFDAEAGVYSVGDKVMYDGKLYEFTSAHETPGDWDSTEVSETTVADELNSLESGLINGFVKKEYSGTTSANGNIFIFNVENASRYVIIAATCRDDTDNTAYIATPYIYLTGSAYQGNGGLNIRTDSITSTAVASTSVHGVIYAIDTAYLVPKTLS